MVIIGLSGDLDPDHISSTAVMRLASRSQAAQYAPKHAMMSRIHNLEADLVAAKFRVSEYEELVGLRKELETTVGSIVRIETGMEDLRHLMQHGAWGFLCVWQSLNVGLPEKVDNTRL